MSKSKNWTAVVEDTLINPDLILTVTGEINIGKAGLSGNLTKKIPQGVTEKQLILEAKPVSDAMPEVSVPVSYKEKLSKGRHQYASILIVVAGSDERLTEITKIDQHIA